MKKLLTAMGGRDAVVSNNNEVFAKQKLQRIKLTWMSILFAVAMTTVIGFSFIACEEDCDCNPKAHLGMNESCTSCAKPNCGECTEQTDAVGGITIRKQSGISVTVMNTVAGNIKTTYGYLSGNMQSTFGTKVGEIHIVSGTEVVLNGMILNVGVSADEDTMVSGIFDVVAQLQQSKGIYLVHAECQSPSQRCQAL
jgi:hypothetical protein